MFGEFITGLIQGLFIGMLFSSLNIGSFGRMFIFVENMIQGSALSFGLIVILIINIILYLKFSRRSIRTNLPIYVFGLVIGIIFL